MLKEEPILPTFNSAASTPKSEKVASEFGEYNPEATSDLPNNKLDDKMNLPGNWNIASPTVREWVSKQREAIQPWTLFISTANFSKPSSVPKLTKRLNNNIGHFKSNYFIVCVVLFLFCLLTSPLLLIVMAASGGACYILKIKQAERKLQIGGKEIGLPQQYGIVAICSLPMFLLAGVSSAVFWVIGASVFVIGLHASFYNYEKIEMDDQEGLTGSIVEEV